MLNLPTLCTLSTIGFKDNFEVMQAATLHLRCSSESTLPVCFSWCSEHSKIFDRGYHALKTGSATSYLESLGNLTAYLLPKNSAGVSFGHLLLRGPIITNAHPTTLDLIYLASKTVLTSRRQQLPLYAGKKQVLFDKLLLKPCAFLRF